MNRLGRLAAPCAIFFALIFGACQVPPTETANNTQPAPAAQPSATPATAVDDRNANNVAVTLPVLDYLFQSDESFANDAKSRLSLTDEQIYKLKEVARSETAKLRVDGEEYTGSTRAAVTQASEQLRSVLGDEKAREFTAFMRTRLSGEEGGNADGNSMNASAGIANERPNSVPSDTRVVVNAPAFRMDVFDNGQLVKSYKIGIGYPEFPLPVGLRRAETIIFNPTWTPPDEPWVEASGKVKVGEKVAAGSKLNPLGPIKIPIGLPSLIHGGKQPARLGNFASHGCVGLTNQGVQDVALVLAKVAGAELTPEEIKEYEKQKTETKNYKLPRAIPVELRYETIVVEDGKLKIYRDVYDRDTNTEENLRRTLEAHGVAFDSLPQDQKANILEALRQMSRDAQGNFDGNESGASFGVNSNANTNAGGNTNANTNTNANANANANKGNSNNSNANGDRVTRNVKGAKEVTFELPQLAGKGYPAPVNMLDASGGQQQKATQGNNRKRA